MIQTDNLITFAEKLKNSGVTLVAVSKTHPISKIKEIYDLGIRDFGENKAQELRDKQPELPADIRWHFIGHLQRNKVKYITPFVHLIHAVDSYKLLKEINKEAVKINRVIDCLLQVFIADEETKFGLSNDEVRELLQHPNLNELQNIRICGLMGMATNTEDQEKVRAEFRGLKQFFDELKSTFFNGQDHFKVLSMGMTSDYEIAIEEGSTMVRLGTLIFGERHYQ